MLTATRPPGASRPSVRYPWIQALRAAAALSVALVHLANDAVTFGTDPGGVMTRFAAAMPWEAGVDIFFVISGFVIVYASGRLFGRPDGWRVFLQRRLTRVVPLYWVMTTAFLALFLLHRHAVHAEIGGPIYILASYVFIPMRRPDQIFQPPLGLGWTLNYEMFFYAVLAALVWLPRARAVGIAAVLLAGLVLAGRFLTIRNPQLVYWADPIVLEFVFGMGVALLAMRGLSLPSWVRAGLVAAAVLALYLDAAVTEWRMLAFGIPGAMLVIAAVSGPLPAAPGLAMRVLVVLGDASYAMYLCHPFAMRGFTVLAMRLLPASVAANGTIMVTIMLLSLVASELCAVVMHVWFERPVMRWLRPERTIPRVGMGVAI